MIERTLRTILTHKKRTLIVITLTFLTGLLLVLPAVEEYSAAKERLQAAHSALTEANEKFQDLPRLRKLLEQKKGDLENLESKAVRLNEIQSIQEMLTTMIRETGCSMRNVSINDPYYRTWMSNDSPINRPGMHDPGKETPYQLVSWQGQLHVEGSMGNVFQFLARLSRIDRFVHTKQVKLERSQRDENLTQLNLQFEMFDLVRKKS